MAWRRRPQQQKIRRAGHEGQLMRPHSVHTLHSSSPSTASAPTEPLGKRTSGPGQPPPPTPAISPASGTGGQKPLELVSNSEKERPPSRRGGRGSQWELLQGGPSPGRGLRTVVASAPVWKHPRRTCSFTEAEGSLGNMAYPADCNGEP